ncbi:hypothetical protein G6F42_018010 [Rhizopus arrhizus]|nr:hypothetical protein G6F42_018010 [Rhizopus arrhizus]
MAHTKSLEAFYSLLDQYKQVAFPSLIDQETSPTATLDLFDTVEHIKHIPDQVVGCKSLGHQNALSRPFCQFLYKQLSKQIRITSFRPSQFDFCIKYLLDGVDSVDEDKEHKVDLLRALSALIFENANNTQRFATRLSKTLLALGNRSSKPLEVRRMAINCIGNACAGAAGNVCAVDRTTQGTIMVASTTLDFADTAVRKVASSTLRSLQFLLAQDKSLVTNPLCDIIEIIYTFIFLHVNVQSYGVGQPLNLTPNRRNRLSQPSTNTASIVANRPLQMSWRTPLHKSSSLVTSSESELSDSASLTELSPRRQRDNAKIRINALLCLSAIANVSFLSNAIEADH